jgi:hypothetical protein
MPDELHDNQRDLGRTLWTVHVGCGRRCCLTGRRQKCLEFNRGRRGGVPDSSSFDGFSAPSQATPSPA